MPIIQAACGHGVDITPGARVYNYYDCGFGTIVRDSSWDEWFTVESEGATYWPAGRQAVLNAERIICVPCGERRVTSSS